MEYIKVDPAEQVLTKQHLYHGQIHLLTIMKKYESYKKLRKEEFMLKIHLRRLTTELMEQLALLDKALPQVKFTHTVIDKTRMIMEGKKRHDLESEIKEIQHKLSRLNSNY